MDLPNRMNFFIPSETEDLGASTVSIQLKMLSFSKVFKFWRPRGEVWDPVSGSQGPLYSRKQYGDRQICCKNVELWKRSKGVRAMYLVVSRLEWKMLEIACLGTKWDRKKKNQVFLCRPYLYHERSAPYFQIAKYHKHSQPELSRGVMTKVLDCGLTVSEFKLQSLFHDHVCLLPVCEVAYPLSNVLNSSIDILL